MVELTPSGRTFSDLVIAVFRANSALLAEGEELTRPVGLTSARWQVLGVVEHGPAPVAHVARTMGLSRQSVQQTADGLARDGMIVYAENPHHRRAKLVVVTPEASRAMERLRELQARWANAAAERFTGAELATAVAVLRGLPDPGPEHARTTDPGVQR